jgi:hypothetical protein
MGRPGAIEVDVNFLIRTPLWPPIAADSKRIGSFQVTRVPMLDVHELAAGKLGALFGRAAIRDVFDTRELLATTPLEVEKLRLGFIAYGGMNRRDWRSVALDDIRTDPRQGDRELMPLLSHGMVPARKDLAAWTERLVSECRDKVSVVLPLRAEEIEFLDCLNDRGDIVPELLTGAADMQGVLRAHPGLRWKARNVREHRGLGEDPDEAHEDLTRRTATMVLGTVMGALDAAPRHPCTRVARTR